MVGVLMGFGWGSVRAGGESEKAAAVNLRTSERLVSALKTTSVADMHGDHP